MSDKVDIFDLLNNVDSGNFEYYDELTPAQQKSISFVVANRWLSCTSNMKQLVAVNSLLNPFVFKFGSKHKQLLYKLMLVASSGTTKKYTWIGKAKKTTNRPLSAKAVSEYYGLSTDRAIGYLNIFNESDLVDLASELGYDDATIKKIKNEYK